MRKALAVLPIILLGSIFLHANSYLDPAKKGLPMSNRLPQQLETESRDATYTLLMNDSWGDGWNGASLDLYINNVLVLDDATVDASTVSVELDVDNHDYIHTVWTSGSFDGECSYGIYDDLGNLVAEAGTVNESGLVLTATVDFSGENVFSNSGFEGANPNDLGRPAEWSLYPDYNWSHETTGNGIHNSEETFVAYDGDKSLKMWNTGGENNVFTELVGDDVPLAGTVYNISAMLYSHADDFLQGGNHGKVTAKFFGFGPNGDGGNWWETMIDMDPNTDGVQFAESEHLDVNSPPSTWTELTLSTTVPEGVYLMQLGVMLAGNEDGSIYVDNLTSTRDEPVPGCTDASACNYDDLATLDDGSCCFGDDCNDIVVDGGSWQGEVSWDIVDESGATVAAGGAPYGGLLCLGDGTYTVNGADSFGDGWNGNYLTVLDSEGHLALSFTLDGAYGTPEGAAGTATFTLPLTPPDANALVLTAVLDMDLPEAGSTGKAVQVQAMDDISDLSWYGVGVANNGGGTDGQEYQFPAVGLDSGQVVWLVRDALAYANYFGANFASNGIVLDASSAISQNGDDAIELFFNGTVVDLYGDLDVDGTGEAWEYTDSWAFRTCNVDESLRTPSTTFDVTQWTLGGPNCSDDSENNEQYDADTNPGGSNCPFPVDEVCDPATYGCTDPLAYGYNPDATDDDGSCYYDGDSCIVAKTAVLGENQADGDDEFFQYTLTANSMLTVSSQNATGDALPDTYLSLHDGDCSSLALLTDTEGNEAVNDDCCDYYGPSTVSVYAFAGTVVTIL